MQIADAVRTRMTVLCYCQLSSVTLIIVSKAVSYSCTHVSTYSMVARMVACFSFHSVTVHTLCLAMDGSFMGPHEHVAKGLAQ